MKLELKHLAPYLPYNLQVEYKGEITTIDALDSSGGVFVGKNRVVSFIDLKNVKPILRPLSSITKEESSKILSKAQGVSVNEDTFRIFKNNNDTIIIQYEYLNDVLLCLSLSYTNRVFIATPYAIYGSRKRVTSTPMFIYDWFIENHFDVFGLIGKGLAIAK